MNQTLVCAGCGKPNPIIGARVGRTDSCFACGADLHACRQCAFFDPLVYNQCRETAAERVTEKERANFCDHFQARGDGTAIGNPTADLWSAAEALFKKNSTGE